MSIRTKTIVLVALLLSALCIQANAHSGRTDGNGGHHDGDDYHYHHGYPAHDHYDIDGDGDIDCPYNFVDNTKETGGNKNPSSSQIGATSQSGNRETNQQKPSDNSGFDWIKAVFAVAGSAAVVLPIHAYFAEKRKSKRNENKKEAKTDNITNDCKEESCNMNSSVIANANYCNKTLYITFTSGGTYAYYNVPESVYNELVKAPSPGKYFQEKIKGKYPYYIA